MTLPEGLLAFAGAHPVKATHVRGQVPLVHRRDPGAPTATLLFCMRAGVRYESADHWGASHFLEHILMRGTDRYATLYDITRRIEGIGGQTSAYSTRDLAAYWVKLPPGQEAVGLDILTQVLFHPTIRAEFIDAERAIIRQERQRERTNPSAFTSQAVESLLLLPGPISRHPVGEDAELARMTPDFVRSFLQESYHRSNLVVAAAGNLAPDLEALVDAALADVPDGPPAVPAEFSLDSRLVGQKVVVHPSAHREQVFVALGWRFPVASRKDLITWRVVNTLLGSGYTSLFNQSLRENESLTYVCSTALNSYAGTGIFKMHMALADRDLERALDRVESIVDDVAKGRVARDIFHEAAVRHAAGVIFRCEDSLEVARLLGHSLARDDEVFHLDAYIREVQAVTMEEASALVKEHLVPSERRLLLHTGSPRVQQCYPDAVPLVTAVPPPR